MKATTYPPSRKDAEALIAMHGKRAAEILRESGEPVTDDAVVRAYARSLQEQRETMIAILSSDETRKALSKELGASVYYAIREGRVEMTGPREDAGIQMPYADLVQADLTVPGIIRVRIGSEERCYEPSHEAGRSAAIWIWANGFKDYSRSSGFSHPRAFGILDEAAADFEEGASDYLETIR